MSKTTEKHFELFKSECDKWILLLGLRGWEIRILHKEGRDGDFGLCRTRTENRTAVIELSKNWPEDQAFALCDEEVKRTAFHEVCHLLVRDLGFVAESRFIDDGEVDMAEHKIIRTLENVLYPKY